MLVIWHSVGSDSGHISVEIHHGGFFVELESTIHMSMRKWIGLTIWMSIYGVTFGLWTLFLNLAMRCLLPT